MFNKNDLYASFSTSYFKYIETTNHLLLVSSVFYNSWMLRKMIHEIAASLNIVSLWWFNSNSLLEKLCHLVYRTEWPYPFHVCSWAWRFKNWRHVILRCNISRERAEVAFNDDHGEQNNGNTDYWYKKRINWHHAWRRNWYGLVWSLFNLVEIRKIVVISSWLMGPVIELNRTLIGTRYEVNMQSTVTCKSLINNLICKFSNHINPAISYFISLK